MARVLYLSPLPPAPTGIATYSAAVLGELRASGFTKRHRVEAPWPIRGRIEEQARAADLPVYHLGNNLDFHRDIYALAARHPGLVVLHDLALDDLGGALLAVGDPLGGPTRVEAMDAAYRLDPPSVGLDEPLRVPWCAYVVRRSRGVIVHSEFGRRYLKAFGSLTPVFVVPHPAVETPRAVRRAERRAARLRNGFPGRVLVGVLGDLGRAKAIGEVLEAVARVGPPAHLVVVGRRIPMFDVEQEVVEPSGHRDRVTVVPDVSDRDFLTWLAACDVVVNLRHPHRGEVSGTVVRALQAGKPTVVPAEGTYLDWPEDAVVRVPAGPPGPDDLAAALGPLVRDPSRRAAVGGRARAHIGALERGHATARGYAEAVEATLRLIRDPGRDALSRWAGSLTDLGASPEMVRRGLGAGYAESLAELAEGPVTA
ncbi:MAG: glycosyltransferase family 4 protein [Actinomycetota bacterium]